MSRPMRAVVLALVALSWAPAARAAEPEKKPDKSERPESASEASKRAGSVLTFYGLRKLEEDPQVSDEEKLREWQSFIERATEQIGYAKKALDRWKNAARLRLIETARASDRESKVEPKEKIRQWREVARLYPKDPEAKTAEKRATFWKQEETKRLVAAAEEVERARRPKVDRIQAWMQVLAWVDVGPEARAANKRIDGLQQQLYSEAESVDEIARVDDRTKLAAWRDVLAGRPNAKQQRAAERRVAELEAALPREAPSKAEPR